MIREAFDTGWEYRPKVSPFDTGSAVKWSSVTLPHDALHGLPRNSDSEEGSATGYAPGGVFEYRKEFAVPPEWAERAVLFDFEGVYRDAVVFINGEYVTHEPNGYAPFVVPAGSYLRYGETNSIAVEARAHRDSRWYTGAGIYRPVHLVVSDPVHIELDGTRVTTPDIDADRAVVAIETTIVNETRHTRSVMITWSVKGPDGIPVASETAPVTILPNDRAVARARVAVYEPRLWSDVEPALYELHSVLHVDDDPTLTFDEEVTAFGIRRLQLDPRNGLRINGTAVKLRGACIHHDNGPIGAATISRAEERRVQLLKSAGFNAIRSAHNPMSRAMLDACDRVGMIVMDELTDVWTRSKVAYDRSIDFPDRWQRDVEAMVRTAFNHPSVVFYSIGNEILELGTPVGSTWGRRIAEAVRSADGTRYVTNAINGVIANSQAIDAAVAEADDPNAMMAEMGEFMAELTVSDLVTRTTRESASVLDVVGFNYAERRYELDAERFPNRVIVGSETFPEKIGTNWPLVARLAHVVGDFTWVGWDYLGEAGIGRVEYTDADDYSTGFAGPFPYFLASSGDLDITGFRRPISYYREIVFGRRTEPYIAVHRPANHGRPNWQTPWSWTDAVASWSWNASEGAPVTVDVYADADEVELLRDGASIATAPVGAQKEFVARFETEYRRGRLTAVGRRGGVEIGRHELQSASGPIRLVAEADRTSLKSDSADLAFVSIRVEDESGNMVCDADCDVTVSVEGAALAGIGSGRAKTLQSFAGPTYSTYDGRAVAVIRPTGAGLVQVEVSAVGYPSARVGLSVGAEPVR